MERFGGLRALGAVLIMMSAGCQPVPVPRLTPAPAAERVPGEPGAARAEAGGVRIAAGAEAWPGSDTIHRELTPVRVSIDNRSAQPLRIRYAEFALVSPSGERFAALPFYRKESQVNVPAVPAPYPPIADPAFGYTNFYVAPRYHSMYPGLQPYPGPFEYDSSYYDTYGDYWKEGALPTGRMIDRALPEGVLEPNGRLDGWLYFEKVRDVPKVTFRTDLVNAETRRIFGEIRIPFTVR
ncbi:hypothetical protein [Methylocaldum sp.]|uniref:hypothetical protein n=1 Tax=Methylocaldum sp. TaxID=1969727 RepID=UPI002D542FAC|nr:hypothetical protein [Methylocaldum sp.]HYE35792.1 hypothetical protein [Methylocaldum sp.]